ncbi:hypothetical protein SAMN05216226_101272 [Halovenus aranensis]|uniref:Uncharacterized protein n=1 Tax=Halovenus aranensis TaxID=890420 RepID=A0A1G8S3W8_9EURY|nr:hypothetical protein [Halovenus aranensis]SDJ23928.1 hypothetical protein SAMN05216226_101272 [Halovenus aranensis]
MASLDTYTCNECGTAFKSMAGANAAEAGYCSPACETEGKGL